MALENTSGRSVLTNYGTRPTDTQYGGETAGESGILRVAEFVFDYDELPGYNAADATAPTVNTTSLAQVIPAGAIITSASFEVITAFTSTSTTSDLLVGIMDDDGGTTISDLDGLFTAAELTQTVIAVAGGRTVSAAGAVLNTRLAEAVQISVSPNVDDLLTGRAKLTVAYIPSVGEQGDQLQDGSIDQS